jgi:putative SOS response-associated peptidase YedK
VAAFFYLSPPKNQVMCGRVTLTSSIEDLCRNQNLSIREDQKDLLLPLPHYNIAPGQHLPILFQDNLYELQAYHWGLVPFWAKKASIGYKMINARIESILNKTAYRQAVQQRRGILFIDGYYEWKKIEGQPTPYRIIPTEEKYIALACICDHWQKENNAPLRSFSIVTQAASSDLETLHHRMPVALSAKEQQYWMDSTINVEELIAEIQGEKNTKFFDYYPVSKAVNQARNNHSGLIEEVSHGPDAGDQLRLF